MATNTTILTCAICHQLLTDAVVHRPCGNAFDRKCLTSHCPATGCGNIIREEDLPSDYTLRNVADEHRLSLITTYSIILIDISTSMSYSDKFLAFLMGDSRLNIVIKIVEQLFQAKKSTLDEKVSLVTFGTSAIQLFDFETITDRHIEILQKLKPVEKDTALFDAIDFCLERFEDLKQSIGDVDSVLQLHIFTDGGNNFGKEDTRQLRGHGINKKMKKLQVSGHVILVGDKKRDETRRLCDNMHFHFHHFNSGNATEFTRSFQSILASNIKAAKIKMSSRIRQRQSVQQNPTARDEEPNQPINKPTDDRVLSTPPRHVRQPRVLA